MLALIMSAALATLQTSAEPVRPSDAMPRAPVDAVQDLGAIVTGVGLLVRSEDIHSGATYATGTIAVRSPSGSGLAVIAIDTGSASVTQSALSISARLVLHSPAGS